MSDPAAFDRVAKLARGERDKWFTRHFAPYLPPGTSVVTRPPRHVKIRGDEFHDACIDGMAYIPKENVGKFLSKSGLHGMFLTADPDPDVPIKLVLFPTGMYLNEALQKLDTLDPKVAQLPLRPCAYVQRAGASR